VVRAIGVLAEGDLAVAPLQSYYDAFTQTPSRRRE
jgi:hypothetical protein